MASSFKPNLLAFKADGVIAKGSAVKIGSDSEHVVECSANTDEAIGVAQGDASAAEDIVEIAIPGGGGKGLAGESITAGKFLVSAADGDLEQTNASGDRIVAMAMEGASAGDLFEIMVLCGVAVGADD